MEHSDCGIATEGTSRIFALVRTDPSPGISSSRSKASFGFDNISLGALPAYNLTTYEQPAEEMIDTLVNMILGRRNKETVSCLAASFQEAQAEQVCDNWRDQVCE